MEEKIVEQMTAVMREADQVFETVGGSTHHYVRDVLLPLMKKNKLAIIGHGEPEINHDRVIANQVAGMPLEEAIFQDGYSAGVEFENKRLQPCAVWVKGEYGRLYEQVKGGKRTVCYVDYNWSVSTLVSPVRDICTIKPEQMELSSRGHCYGSARDWVALEGLAEKEAFVKMCEDSNVEWLDEGTVAAGREEASNALYETRLALRMVLKVFKNYQISKEQEKYYSQAEGILKKHGKVTEVLRTGREEDAVMFAEWAGWDWRRVEGKSMWENQKTLEVLKSNDLYERFQKETGKQG